MNETIETENEVKQVGGIVILVLFFLVITIIYMISKPSYDIEQRKKESIELFKSDVALICRRASLLNADALLVKQSNGWSVYNEEYFIKDNVMLNIMNCSVGEEE